MGTLTDDHRAILERLDREGLSVDDLSGAVDAPAESIEEQLITLEENGLVHRTGGGWSLTENGRRVLEAPGDGSADEEIDTPEQANAMIEAFQLRPDREDAVRSAYVFLRRRKRAVRSEIHDTVFDEHPAGYDDPELWWDGFLAEHLSALPGIVSPDDPDEPWQYTGESWDEDSR